MNPRIFYLSVFLSLFIWSCSSDDAEEQEPLNEQNFAHFQFIGEDENSIFWYDYDAEQELLSSMNLTADDNLDRFYITLRQVDEVLSFFSLFQGSFSLFQKNIRTNSISTTEDFISITGERSVIWGANSETQILIGYYSPPGSGEFGVRVLDTSTGNFVDTPLASNVFDTLDPLYFNQRLFAAFMDNNDRYYLIVFNTADFSIVRGFDFGDEIPSFLIDDNGNLVLLRGRQGVFTKEVYAPANMDLLMSQSFELNEFFDPGPINAYLRDNKLYYQSALVQPAPIAYTPAVYNFDNAENPITDILTIRETVIDQLGQNFIPTAFGFDSVNRNFLMGFANTSPAGTFNGGVIIIAEDGSLVETLELSVVPTYFIKN